MNKIQFNVDEDCLYTPISSDVVDISSESEDAFSIEPGANTQLEERFRINPAGSNLMSAFVGTTTAILFPIRMLIWNEMQCQLHQELSWRRILWNSLETLSMSQQIPQPRL